MVVVQIAVHDTGIGISKEAHRHIFDAFSQADGTTTRKFGGTGLGLSIAKQLVELMQGTISVESTPGEGSSFSFTARFSKPLKTAPIQRALPQSVQGLRVLIADDNATNLSILKHQMLGWGMQPDVVQNGRQALERLRAAASEAVSYDMAIFDMKMPDMDGLMVAEAIKAEPKIAPRRMAILSSVALEGDADAAREAGVSMFLRKPLRQRELYRALTTMMKEDEETTSTQGGGVAETRQPLVQFDGQVLLVEDNPVNQELAQNVLEVFGCQVDVAANGHEAVAAFSHGSYDLVLMDCQMPEMDGFEATAEIRRREAHQDNSDRLPIVALTAHALQGDHEHCLAAGMDDYLSKPFTQDQLMVVLERWLPKKDVTMPDQGHSTSPVSSTTGETAKPPDTATHISAVDLQTLVAIRALQRPGKPDVLDKAINIYLDTAPQLLHSLRIGLDTRDAAAVHRAAHSLKSSSANLGALELAALCKELETMGRTQALDQARPLLMKLEMGYTTVQRVLQDELQANRERNLTGSGSRRS
jgi:CheY-like chemotaxis protein